MVKVGKKVTQGESNRFSSELGTGGRVKLRGSPDRSLRTSVGLTEKVRPRSRSSPDTYEVHWRDVEVERSPERRRRTRDV